MLFTVFQTLVRRWVVRAFGEDVANDRAERTHRFLEEALELAQATECTQEQAHLLVEYVYGRPMGKPGQEVGGTLLTLAALCSARSIDMNVEAAAEITRVNKPETLEKIRRKQEAKKRDIPLDSPLPGQPTPDAWCPACRQTGRTTRVMQQDGILGHLRCATCFCVVGDRVQSVPLNSKCLVTGQTLGETIDD